MSSQDRPRAMQKRNMQSENEKSKAQMSQMALTTCSNWLTWPTCPLAFLEAFLLAQIPCLWVKMKTQRFIWAKIRVYTMYTCDVAHQQRHAWFGSHSLRFFHQRGFDNSKWLQPMYHAKKKCERKSFPPNLEQTLMRSHQKTKQKKLSGRLEHAIVLRQIHEEQVVLLYHWKMRFNIFEIPTALRYCDLMMILHELSIRRSIFFQVLLPQNQCCICFDKKINQNHSAMSNSRPAEVCFMLVQIL